MRHPLGITVIYKKGVLRPLEPLELKEGEKLEIEFKKPAPAKSVIEAVDHILKPTKKKIIEEVVELSELGEGFE